jgi:hypothetical protein
LSSGIPNFEFTLSPFTANPDFDLPTRNRPERRLEKPILRHRLGADRGSGYKKEDHEMTIPLTEVQGFLVAPRLRRITYASLQALLIPKFKSSGFSGRFDKETHLAGILIKTGFC